MIARNGTHGDLGIDARLVIELQGGVGEIQAHLILIDIGQLRQRLVGEDKGVVDDQRAFTIGKMQTSRQIVFHDKRPAAVDARPREGRRQRSQQFTIRFNRDVARENGVVAKPQLIALSGNHEVGRNVRIVPESDIEFIDGIVHLDDAAVFEFKMVDEAVAQDVPRTTVLERNAEPDYVAVVGIAVVDLARLDVLNLSINFLFVALIGLTVPYGILTSKDDVHIGVDQIAATCRATRIVGAFKNDVASDFSRVFPFLIDFDDGVSARINGFSISGKVEVAICNQRGI